MFSVRFCIRHFLIPLVFLLIVAALNPTSANAQGFYDKFNVTDTEGVPADLNQYRGGYVLINFWATWCPPCVKEMPAMNRLQQLFETDEFQIVAINMGQSQTTVDSFFMEQEFEFDIPVYLDDKGRAMTDLNIQGMPSSFMVDPEGNLIETIIGAREWDHPANVEALKQLISGAKKGA